MKIIIIHIVKEKDIESESEIKDVDNEENIVNSIDGFFICFIIVFKFDSH